MIFKLPLELVESGQNLSPSPGKPSVPPSHTSRNVSFCVRFQFTTFKMGHLPPSLLRSPATSLARTSLFWARRRSKPKSPTERPFGQRACVSPLLRCNAHSVRFVCVSPTYSDDAQAVFAQKPNKRMGGEEGRGEANSQDYLALGGREKRPIEKKRRRKKKKVA